MRFLTALAAAAALLGGRSVAAPETIEEEKVRRARERRDAELETIKRQRAERADRQRRVEIGRHKLALARHKMLEQGIEPDTGRPLSRQQRRARERGKGWRPS
jgi:hypothetical protein